DEKFFVAKQTDDQDENTLSFLEYLVGGKVDLYYLKEFSVERYFIRKEGGRLIELKNDKKEIIANGVPYQIESNEYKNILKSLFFDISEVYQKIESINFKSKKLVDIVIEYNEHSKSEYMIYGKKVPDDIQRKGIQVGMNKLNFVDKGTISDEFYYYSDNNTFNTLYPSIGFFYHVDIQKNSNNLFFQYDGNYSYYNINSTHIFIRPGDGFTHKNDIELSRHIFTNNISLSYEFGNGTIRPRLNMGGFFSFAFLGKYNRDYEVKNTTGDIILTENFNKYDFLNLDGGYLAGVGIIGKFNQKDIFIDFTYRKGRDLIQGFGSNFYGLIVGYQLW
ncbi:MAG: hypothetical protein OEY34_01135, partial [Cyclobacteriaceae bacterium]|nr:hypothetical protein [Cyclobacteriaceae bacterium]